MKVRFTTFIGSGAEASTVLCGDGAGFNVRLWSASSNKIAYL